MERNEGKLRARLARAKGGHRKVLQGRLDAMMAQRGSVETPAPAPDPVVEEVVAPTPKKKTTSKKKKWF